MVEISLIHDGKFWVTSDGPLHAKATTLEGLDRELGRRLKEQGALPGEQVKVRMTFDNSGFPQWIRQYSGHYFNRVVTIDI